MSKYKIFFNIRIKYFYLFTLEDLIFIILFIINQKINNMIDHRNNHDF